MSAAASFNATMNAQAQAGNTPSDIEGRVTRLESILGALSKHPAIADAMQTAEAEAEVVAQQQRVAAERAAAEAADKAKTDKVAALRAQLAALEADGSIPSPAAVAAGFNPTGAPADG